MAMEDILLILALDGSSHNKRHKFFELRIQKSKKTKKESAIKYFRPTLLGTYCGLWPQREQ